MMRQPEEAGQQSSGHIECAPDRLKETGRSRRIPPRHAFTLIELLVVIAIIALLAAILFPVFAKARLRSTNAVCLSNLRQLGIVMQGYTEDNDDHMPVGVDVYWSDIMRVPVSNAKYLRYVMEDRANPELWHCPADQGFKWWSADYQTARFDYTPSCYEKKGQSYDYNFLMVWDPQHYRLAPVPVSGVKRPAEIVLLKDAHFMWHNANSPRLPLIRSKTDPAAWNVLYLDGHARRLVNARGWNSTDLRDFWNLDNNPR